MTNFDVAQDALQTSLNSSGSAMREHEKWMQSLEAFDFASIFGNKYHRTYLIAGRPLEPYTTIIRKLDCEGLTT